jgi:hypothetical protein
MRGGCNAALFTFINLVVAKAALETHLSHLILTDPRTCRQRDRDRDREGEREREREKLAISLRNFE